MSMGSAPRTLAALPLGVVARIVSIVTDTATRHYLMAVGLREGDTAEVLRRAIFGGPLHIRAECGAEFALAKALAEQVRVESS